MAAAVAATARVYARSARRARSKEMRGACEEQKGGKRKRRSNEINHRGFICHSISLKTVCISFSLFLLQAMQTSATYSSGEDA